MQRLSKGTQWPRQPKSPPCVRRKCPSQVVESRPKICEFLHLSGFDVRGRERLSRHRWREGKGSQDSDRFCCRSAYGGACGSRLAGRRKVLQQGLRQMGLSGNGDLGRQAMGRQAALRVGEMRARRGSVCHLLSNSLRSVSRDCLVFFRRVCGRKDVVAGQDSLGLIFDKMPCRDRRPGSSCNALLVR